MGTAIGHLDQDELPHEGALREVAEEVGLSPRIIPFGVDLKMPAQNPVERQAPTPYAIFREVIPQITKILNIFILI